MIVSKVQKWGNSQGVRLSKQLLSQADLRLGDDVEIVVTEDQILVRKATKLSSKFDLRELVKQIPRGYRSREESFGRATGKEEW